MHVISRRTSARIAAITEPTEKKTFTGPSERLMSISVPAYLLLSRDHLAL